MIVVIKAISLTQLYILHTMIFLYIHFIIFYLVFETPYFFNYSQRPTEDLFKDVLINLNLKTNRSIF